MSWKGVELQVALPRVQDSGQLQEQMQQRGQQSQSFMGQAHLSDMEKLRKAVIQANQKDQARFQKDAHENNKDQSAQQHKSSINKSNNDEVQQEHPYLGKIIDYSS